MAGAEGDMERHTVDLSGYPDLVVIYLGMRVNSLRGLPTLLSFRSKIQAVIDKPPPGLLANDWIIYSLFPLHMGMRQYWKDFESLETWARSGAHREWWQTYVKDTRGTGFWHEAYFMGGGMETVAVNMPQRLGFRKFAPEHQARGSMFSARTRARREGTAQVDAPVTEHELYGNS